MNFKVMTEATKNKYTDQWFRKEAHNLKLTPSDDLATKVFSEAILPESTTSWSKRIWAFAAVGLIAVISLSVISITTQESNSSLIVELSSMTQDDYFKSYSDFLQSSQYAQLEEAYADKAD